MKERKIMNLLWFRPSTKVEEAEKPCSLYKTETGRLACFKSYDKIMKNHWPVAFTEEWVLTSPFGKTHVIVSGPADGKPIILLPGLFADATMWYATVGDLVAAGYRVLCTDHIVFGGKSELSNNNSKGVKNTQDYGVWFSALLDHFRYSKVVLGGLSYGSWLSLELARMFPEKVSALVLLDPSETFIKMDGGIAWRGFWTFMFFPSRRKHKDFFDWMGGGSVGEDPIAEEEWMEHMLDVIEFGSVGMFDIPQHHIYTHQDLKKLSSTPCIILVGGKPIVYKDPKAFVAAAKRALPHAEIRVIPDTGHGLHTEKSKEVNFKVVTFLDVSLED